MTPNPSFKYTGTTPGADTTERDIFNTVTAFGYNSVASPGSLQRAGIKRLIVHTNLSGAQNLKFYFSSDGGTNWVEDPAFLKVAAVGVSQNDFLVEHVAQWDVKITATNQAAAAQTTYTVTIVGTMDRAVAA